METITIKLSKPNFDNLVKVGALTKYEVKEVSVENDLFKDDPTHEILKKASIKAYKALKEYEFNKRHNIRK